MYWISSICSDGDDSDWTALLDKYFSDDPVEQSFEVHNKMRLPIELPIIYANEFMRRIVHCILLPL